MMAEEREVLLYCDFHGHSIKKDVFMYGCNDPDNKKENIFIRIFPLLLAKRNKMFSFKNSIFRISKDKLSTGRVVCYNDIGIISSYTMEASFYGPSHSAALENRNPDPDELNGDAHMTIENLENMGKDFCKQLLVFTNNKEFSKRIREISASFNEYKKIDNILEKSFDDLVENDNDEDFDIQNMINNINESEINQICIENDTDSGSDSENSENDDKKYEYKHKQLKSAHTSIKPGKSFNNFVKKRKSEVPDVIKFENGQSVEEVLHVFDRKKNLQYSSPFRELSSPYRLSSGLADHESKQPPLTRAVQPGGGFKSGLKFAAAVKLPKESSLINTGIYSKMKSFNDKKKKFDKTVEKSEFIKTNIKFKEILIPMAYNTRYRAT